MSSRSQQVVWCRSDTHTRQNLSAADIIPSRTNHLCEDYVHSGISDPMCRSFWRQSVNEDLCDVSRTPENVFVLEQKFVLTINAFFVILTVRFPKFLTRQFRYAVLPTRAVTFLEADISKYGPLSSGFLFKSSFKLLLLLCTFSKFISNWCNSSGCPGELPCAPPPLPCCPLLSEPTNFLCVKYKSSEWLSCELVEMPNWKRNERKGNIKLV